MLGFCCSRLIGPLWSLPFVALFAEASLHFIAQNKARIPSYTLHLPQLNATTRHCLHLATVKLNANGVLFHVHLI
ncbi:hypothetical protein AXF42_Ash013394 [Apostasia shenzhenica]|uniref:Secreted protein n=1 Tax=Apostasia shenzhenica TaxID=1088818 RepID=A0A2I0A436_9ASPA|nr:hypothetical protein AXF42_Ash013394 [Apostasia shenzhenica]